MSKIGKIPVEIPSGVSVNLMDGNILIKGTKGELSKKLPEGLVVNLVNNKEVVVSVKGKSKLLNSLHGTYRSLINNMIKGVSEGWSKQLELVGAGYRAEVIGKTLNLTVGYSHPIKIEAPENISFKVEKNIITVEGLDKEIVGLIAARIRLARPPEPYKGKGIKYIDEIIRRKAGKAAKTVGVGS